MNKIKILNCLLFSLIGFMSCRSNLDFEKIYQKEQKELLKTESTKVKQQKENDYFIERENNRPIIINVENPQIKTVETKPTKTLTGAAALKENRVNSLVQAKFQDGHLLGWVYKEDALYEIQTQTFHSTFIELEPGEQMLEEPYISEPDVWRISRGVSYKEGLVTQHLVIKPDFANLDSTLIIVTDRRVYHLEIKSFKDRYMPIVRWIYPHNIEDSPSWKEWIQSKQEEKEILSVSPNEKYLSFDYKMNYSKINTPYWLPTKVYDDGKKTYILLNEQVLTTQMPAVFNERNKIINYRVQKNAIIIDQLIKKATLKIGFEKVTIKKKKVSKSKAKKIYEQTLIENSKIEEPETINKNQPIIKPIDPIKRAEEKKDEEVLPGTEEAIKNALDNIDKNVSDY